MVTKAKDSHANAKPKQIKARTIHAYGTIISKPDTWYYLPDNWKQGADGTTIQYDEE